MKQEIENQDMPEVGELVLALVTSMSSHGAKVVLEEYNNMLDFCMFLRLLRVGLRMYQDLLL